MFVSIK